MVSNPKSKTYDVNIKTDEGIDCSGVCKKIIDIKRVENCTREEKY